MPAAPVIDLSLLTTGMGFGIQGDAADDGAGISVALVGDVNGDGIDDMIVGAPNADITIGWEGEAYVIYGRSGNDRGLVDLGNLSAADGFVIQGDAGGDNAGSAVSSAGDVNGDGIGDLIIGAAFGSDGGVAAGEAYVIYGMAGTTRGAVDLTGLAASDGFIIQGDTDLDFAGFSVGSLGDVNGDGIDDVIVGARRGDDGGGDAGEAYVIYGTLGNTRGTLDLSSLTPTQGFIIRGDAAGDEAGRSVAGAGDVNGDGIGDIIVGAPFGDDGGDYAGETYVIYGVATATRSTIDLSTLSINDGFIIQGDDANDNAGYSVAAAGDVNGDGIGDLILGAIRGADGGTFAGEAYVVYGVAGTRAMLDLTTLTPTQGFAIQGDINGDFAGISVSSAGDMNGDGIGDLIVGARYGDTGLGRAGEAYVIFGVAGTTRGRIDLTGFDASDGFILRGGAPGDYAGTAVSGGRDVNGDGLDDLIIGAPGNDDGGLYAGAAYVVYGTSVSGFGPVVDLSALTSAYGFIIQGDVLGDKAGYSVSDAGDVNGDGIDDIIIGAIYNDYSGFRAGEAYVIYGVAGSTRTLVDLSGLYNRPSDGFIISGDSAEDETGLSVSSAGDVNGDGIGDLIVGAPYGDNGGIDAGEAYVIYGVAGSTRGTVDLTGLAAGDGFIIQGDFGGDFAGRSVSSAGDVNGDGIDDVIVGAPRGDDGGTSAGEAYVIYGVTGSTRGTLDLTNLAAGDGFIIRGDTAGDQAGFSVSGAGDVNGDGIDDLIIGARYGDDGGSYAGEAYVIYGVTGTTRGTLDLTGLAASDGFIIQGDTANDRAGFSVSAAGDVNGDGIDDVIVGAPRGVVGGVDAGVAYVIYGVTGTSRGTIDLTSLSLGDGFIIQGAAEDDSTGISVSSAGDVNGDGIDDLIIGAPGADGGGDRAGAAYVIFGAAGTRGTVELSLLTPEQGFIIQGDVEDDNAGFSVSAAGDVNGDGIDDLIVGVRYGDDGGPDAGEAYVIYGRRPTQAVQRTGTDIAQAIFGGHMDDTLDGLGGNDTLDGGEGDDILIDGAGDDSATGGGGDDLFVAGTGANRYDGGEGSDTVDYSTYATAIQVNLATGSTAGGLSGNAASNDTLTSIENLVGTRGNDTLTGDGTDNTLDGFDGNDTLSGGDGSDTLIDGSGDDVALGGEGDDVFIAGSGANSFDGGDDRDTVDYSAYATAIQINLATGSTAGGLAGNAASNDTLISIENLVGTRGNDTLTGNDEANTLDGFDGNDTLSDAGGNDTLLGGAGDDLFIAGSGANSFDGGEGSDTVDYSTYATAIQVNLATGSTAGGLSGNAASNDTLTSIENLVGTRGNDTLTGSDGANLLNGFNGNDTISDGAGDDTVIGGIGNDLFIAGSGSNSYDGGEGSDTLDYSAFNEAIRIDLAANTTSGGASPNAANDDTIAGIENLIGTSASDTLSGDDGANLLNGGDGNDWISDLGGDDTLIGGEGDDDFTAGAGANSFDGGEGSDTVDYSAFLTAVNINLATGSTAGGLAGNAAGNDTLISIENLVGTQGNDTLTGNDEDNLLFGGHGNDTISDGFGNDTVDSGNGNDVIRVGGGANTFDGEGGSDTLDFSAYSTAIQINLATNSTAGGTPGNVAADDTIDDFENLIGTSGNDTLIGSADANRLEGFDGNDSLLGDLGADSLFGGVGNDTVRGGSNADRINGDTGADILYGDGSSDTIYGGDGIDEIYGGGSADLIYGGSQIDTIFGGTNNDRIYGGGSSDFLTGGSGSDEFVFSTAIGVSIDTITDFSVADDTIWLEDSIFTGLAAGALGAGAFASNLSGTATALTHRVIYDTNDGFLYFDADGSGAGARVQFATLSAGLALAAADFLVV